MAGIRHPVQPRDVPPDKAARRLHLTLDQFEAVQHALFDRGFPRPDETTGMYDLVAIDAWMNRRSRLAPSDGLTPGKPARDAGEVYGERARRLLNG